MTLPLFIESEILDLLKKIQQRRDAKGYCYISLEEFNPLWAKGFDHIVVDKTTVGKIFTGCRMMWTDAQLPVGTIDQMIEIAEGRSINRQGSDIMAKSGTRQQAEKMLRSSLPEGEGVSTEELTKLPDDQAVQVAKSGIQWLKDTQKALEAFVSTLKGHRRE